VRWCLDDKDRQRALVCAQNDLPLVPGDALGWREGVDELVLREGRVVLMVAGPPFAASNTAAC